METLLPPKPRSYTSRRVARFAGYFSVTCLMTVGFVLAASTAYAINHPPTVSWIQDQAIKTGMQFMGPVFFRAWDKETTLSTTKLTYLVENDPTSPTFYTGIVHINA